MPNYGSQGRGEEEIRDWLLGGNRKRRILERLADDRHGGWSADVLALTLQCGPATVYETLRALRGARLLETVKPRRYRLASGTDLPDALRGLITVLGREGDLIVDRPPRNRG